MKTVLALIDHPNLDLIIIPVLEQLRSRGINTKVYLTRAGRRRFLDERGISYSANESVTNEFLKTAGQKLFLNAADQNYQPHWLGRHLDELFRKEGIPSLTIEHGSLAMATYIKPSDISAADKMAVIGKADFDGFVKIGVPTEKLVLTGFPPFDSFYHFKKGRLFKRGDYIYIAGQNHTYVTGDGAYSHEQWTSTLHACYKKLLEMFPDLGIIVKPHPAEGVLKTIYMYEDAIDSDWRQRIKIVDTEFSNMEGIYESAFVFSFSSSVFFESLLLDKNAVYVTTAYGDFFAGMADAEKEGAFFFKTLRENICSDLSEHLDDFLRQNHERLLQPIIVSEKFIENYIYKFDGKASERIADAAISMMESAVSRIKNSKDRPIFKDVGFERYQRLMGIAEEAELQDAGRYSLLDVGSLDGMFRRFVPGAVYESYNGFITRNQKTQYDDNAFDVVVAADVLEHVPEEDREAFIKELVRIAGKKVVFSFPGEGAELSESFILTVLPNHKWLKEHQANRLPRVDDVNNILNRIGLSYNVKPNHSLPSWIFSVLFDNTGIDAAVRQRVNSFMQEHFFEAENREPAYRYIYTIDKKCCSPGKGLERGDIKKKVENRQTHSTIVNRQKWSNYAWSQAGDEWSAAWGGTDNLWKKTIYPRIKLNLPADNILEIAPGFGRITQYLASLCKTLTVVDLTPRCIEACKERFKDYSHIRYFVNDGKSLEMIADNSIDFVFSWDSLVHAESDVLRSYLLQLSRKLKEGGAGFLHHSNVGAYKNPDTGQLSIVNKHWRATSMSAELFRQYCNEAGLVCVTQEIIGWGGNILNDCFSYFIKDSSYSGPGTIVNELPDFMNEAAEAKKLSQTDIVEPYKTIQQLLDSGAYEDALTSLEKFIKDNPSHALANNDIAALYYQKGDKSSALKYFRKAANIEPSNLVYQRNLANILVDMNSFSDALTVLSKLVREHPDDVETLIAMGSLCHKLGAKDDAKMFWESALEIDPDNAVAMQNLNSLKPEGKEIIQQPVNGSTSIIIPVFNKVELTAQCLEALVANTEITDYEVIIIDNASTDKTAEFLKNLGGDVKIITNKENLGFAKACNQGAKAAAGEFLVFLNNDTIPQAGWLTELLDFIKSHSEAAIVGSKLLYPDGTIQHCGASMRFDGKFFRHPYKFLEASHPLVDRVRELDAVTAACIITRKDVFFKAGMFDEQYLNGCEDMDYCTAVRNMGYRIYYNPRAVLFHLESQTPRTTNKDEKNFARYLSKWGNARMKNEIEIYAEDGFWKRDEKDSSLYVKSSNNYLAEWQNIIADAQKANDNISAEKYKRIISKIYPVDKWIKPKASKKKEIDNSKPLKVLFVCHDFPPYRYAGAQLYAMNLAKALNKSGKVQVDIFHPIFREGYSKFEIIESHFEGLNVYKLSKDITVAFDKSVRHPIVADFFDRFLYEHQYDCIHIHGLGQLSAVPIEIAYKHNIPIVATLHDYWFLCYFWHMITPDQKLCTGPESIGKCARCFIKYTVRSKETNDIYDKAYGFMQSRKNYFVENFRKIKKVFAPSHFLAEKFNKYGFDNITVSPLGMVPMEAKQKQDSAVFTFGFVGQIIYRKGIETLLEAFKRLNHKSAVLVVYGKSDNDAYLKKIINMIEAISNAYYKGGYTPEDLPDIMSGIDISVIPSLMENYPLVVQEAFMNKVPVIASNVGGIPEVVKDGQNGFLFNVQDVVDLQKKMAIVLDDPHIIESFRSNITPVKTIEEDALFYSSIYGDVTIVDGCQTSIISNQKTNDYEHMRILFYFFKNVHIPILIPIYEKLKKLHPEVKIAFGYMQYAPEMRAGFTPDELKIIESYGEKMYAVPQEFKPDITFIADSVYPWVKNCGKLVHVGHGVLSKGQYYTDTAIARREEQADLVCVPGSYHAEIMRKIISKPVVATGMAKLDPLFSGEINRRSALEIFDLPEHYRYILFAPTFNDELSAIPFVMDEVYKLLPDKHTCLLIKLHGSAKKQYKDMYRDMMRRFSRIIYVDDLDITPLLAIADVMVSDVSSAMMEFAALDKPLVLFNNPNWKKYQNFNPNDIEFKWRDIGIQVKDIEEMRLAVQRSLWQPEEFSSKRKHYTDQLFANKTRGDAAEKIINKAFEMFLQK
jgi:GT2 family glycosyltransferase/glycosyltransferase involved in cell wall biosynthesis/ubiquinone/menaquinone biosynthesis C-methylase UbiE/predicted negative regulator of RcsB-dependent stress response